MKKFVNIAGELAPYLIVGLVFLVTVSALVSLVLVDVITGQISGDYLSNDWKFGLFTSLAGTGMLISCGVLISYFFEKEQYVAVGITLVVFLVLQSADVYFDAISVDVKRFGHIVSVYDIMTKPEAMAHNIYRFFVAGISFVGEPLGVGSIVAFPLLKKWLLGIIDLSDKKNTPATPSNTRPGGMGMFSPNLPRPTGNGGRPTPKPHFVNQNKEQPEPKYHPIGTFNKPNWKK